MQNFTDFMYFCKKTEFVFPEVIQYLFELPKMNPILYFVFLQKLKNNDYKIPQNLYINAQQKFSKICSR